MGKKTAITEPSRPADIIVPPLRRNFSREELMRHAKDYMRDTYGIPSDMSPEEQDRYHRRLGMIVDFIDTIIP